MPPKCRIIYESDNDDDVAENATSSAKRPRASTEENHCDWQSRSGIDEDAEFPAIQSTQIRRSSCTGKGSGGQLAQMRNLERMQTEPRPRRLTNLEITTQGEDVNPMAPSQPESQVGTAPQSKPRPKPRVRTKAGTLPPSKSQVPPTVGPQDVQPSFSLAAPGQKFSFRLPEPVPPMPPHSSAGPSSQLDIRHRNHAPIPVPRLEPDLLSNTSAPPLSRSSSVFSGSTSRSTSTAPTSRMPSICSSSQANHGYSQNSPGHVVQSSQHEYAPQGRSSHLKMLALACQTSVRAPSRVSHATSEATTSNFPPCPQHSLHSDSRGDSGQLPAASQERQQSHSLPQLASTHSISGTPTEFTIPPFLRHDDFDEPASPPPQRAGLRRTESFYHLPPHVNISMHSLSAASNQYEGGDAEANVEDDLIIDEASPSEDDRFAEAVIRGEGSSQTSQVQAHALGSSRTPQVQTRPPGKVARVQ
ncbi:hypothetical protein HYDPIDRAFT_29263 [Hydnomerulius pinastri MD-312]|uniref:Uncharacterized protein n=1 Tax=Hydnomerulius pinastri MD-312 TaxID=994086 RepID=A0A0C9W8N6_9AGAM|nr:hypothetical protein HYDPIDRAFT_29263 [Hydnomerulius pinastri MD-312]